MQTAFQVAHTVPGRIRVRLPGLKRYPDYATLQQKVQALGAVTVRINPSARSLIVQYDSHSTPETTFNNNLIAAIALTYPTPQVKVTQHDRPTRSKLPPDCEPLQLTAYEKIQFEAIKAWKHRQIGMFKEIVGQLLMASRGLLSFICLNTVLEKIAQGFEQVTGSWQQDWEKLKPLAGVEAAIDLRGGAIEQCDRLSKQVTKAAKNRATVQGSLSGLFDVFGAVADEGLTLVLALQTIHRIGLCYGYAPQTPDEHAFAWAIFNAAIASTQDEYENTQSTLRYLQRSLNKQALEDEALQDTLEEDVEDLLVDSAIAQGLAQLSGGTFGGVIPVLSMAMNSLADRGLIEEISEAAKREFQLRWLLENRKVRFPEPST